MPDFVGYIAAFDCFLALGFPHLFPPSQLGAFWTPGQVAQRQLSGLGPEQAKRLLQVGVIRGSGVLELFEAKPSQQGYYQLSHGSKRAKWV